MTKQHTRLLLVAIVLVVAIIATVIYQKRSPGPIESGTSYVALPHAISLKVYETEQGWGYEIYADTTLLLFQELIPGVAGEKRFLTQTDAMKCGELVIKKIKSNSLPFISIDELDSLGIFY